MTKALLDDHLLRDLLADDIGVQLNCILSDHEPATTNLYLYRLSKSVASARGGSLTGSWSSARRRALGATLMALPTSVEVVAMRFLTYRMAEICDVQRVSTLGAEAVAAAEHLDASLCVWDGDDGPAIRSAAAASGTRYVAIAR